MPHDDQRDELAAEPLTDPSLVVHHVVLDLARRGLERALLRARTAEDALARTMAEAEAAREELEEWCRACENASYGLAKARAAKR